MATDRQFWSSGHPARRAQPHQKWHFRENCDFGRQSDGPNPTKNDNFVKIVISEVSRRRGPLVVPEKNHDDLNDYV